MCILQIGEMMKDFVKGIYKKSIFKSDKGYIIGLLRVYETNIIEMQEYVNRTITFTGYFAELLENDKYTMYGEIANHPKYGFQFNVKEYERVKPEDKTAIVEFLSSDLFKGIGEKMALKIVNELGDDTLELILQDKNVLRRVPRLKEDKIDLIYQTLKKHEESHDIIVKLNELGFSMKDSLAIYNVYKSNTLNVIDKNLYRLIEDVDNITFSKVDEIALKLNDDKYNINRIKACIIYLMNELSFKKGDTYLSYSEIYEALTYYIDSEIDVNIFDEALSDLDGELQIKIEDDKYYLMDYYENEEYIANKIKYLVNKNVTKLENIDMHIKELENKFGIDYSTTQEEAITKALENNITIITGGPGTGKTTIIKAIVNLYKMINNLSEQEMIKKIAL